jgi:hypothetical protein
MKENKKIKDLWNLMEGVVVFSTIIFLISLLISLYEESFKPIGYVLGLGLVIVGPFLFYNIKKSIEFENKWVRYIEKNTKEILRFTKPLIYNAKTLESYEDLSKSFLKNIYYKEQLEKIYNLFIKHKEREIDNEILEITSNLKNRIN